MNNLARLLFAALTAVGIAVLSGCASHPELRPYTGAETRQLQLEALQRQGLSLDEYERHKRIIQRAADPQVLTERAAPGPSIKG
ncbi:hypothetical protein JET76_10680 [Pseudomonas putida]|uniref:hypothetical protein n=1 Tax=Pseudomonas putida TaxID=303 RepID=UPI000DB2ED3D|nr:hypothetical protein [Pseudomonas putida]MBI6941805.1 hypothetical protein [Pseudomonas putida]MBI6958124.1 hypothetical protein [Pseudomonas putida]PZQ41414.1 MAG: hypothetical protein DI560_06215 [Pseudomonas putida]